MRDFLLEIFSHHGKKMTKTFKQSLKTKNSKGGKLIKFAFYGNVYDVSGRNLHKNFLKIVNKRRKNT